MAINFKRFALVVLALLLAASCARNSRPQIEFAMGTINAVHLFENSSDELYSRIFSRIREIDWTMSSFPGEFQEIINSEGVVEPDAIQAVLLAAESLASGVVVINMQAGIAPVKVRADIIEVLERALYYAEVSDGAFDPTIGPLVKLWGIGGDNQRIPGRDEIAAALELVNWRDVVIDKEAGTVFLRKAGMALDLGAIAKGYAGDEAARITREAKVKRAIIDLGGNIVVVGWREKTKKELLPWRIGVQNPVSVRGAYIGILPVHDTSVVTSGVYERYFEEDGVRYHHLFSTTDGYPVNNGLMSATIVTESSTEADALSTVVFTLGYERARALVDTLPGVEALFIFNDRTVRMTGGLAEIFILTDDEFVIVP